MCSKHLLTEQKEGLKELGERIQLLQAQVNTKFNSLVPRSILSTRFDFGRLLQDADNVILLGYTHSGLLRTYKREIIKAIKNGIKTSLIGIAGTK